MLMIVIMKMLSHDHDKLYTLLDFPATKIHVSEITYDMLARNEDFRFEKRVDRNLMASDNTPEGNVLFNDALNTFYLRFYMASDILYAPSHRQDSTYHSLCYTSRGALAGTRNSSMGPPHKGSIRRPIAP